MMTPIPIERRFWRFVEKTDGCWNWTGSKNNHGYGMVGLEGRSQLAHRVSLRLAGRDPSGLIARHHCDNPACVRPDHLTLGTHRENTADMVRRGRARHGEVRGESHPGHRLKAVDVSIARYLRECGVRVVLLARLFGISDVRMGLILNNKAWTHVAPLEAA